MHTRTQEEALEGLLESHGQVLEKLATQSTGDPAATRSELARIEQEIVEARQPRQPGP